MRHAQLTTCKVLALWQGASPFSAPSCLFTACNAHTHTYTHRPCKHMYMHSAYIFLSYIVGSGCLKTCRKIQVKCGRFVYNNSTSKAIACIIIIKHMVRQAVVRRRKPNMPEVPRPPTLQEATAHPTPSSRTSIDAATLCSRARPSGGNR